MQSFVAGAKYVQTIRQSNSVMGVTLEKRGNQDTAKYVRDQSGRLIAIENSSGDFYYLYDSSGNVIGLINTDGTVGYYGYQPFGEDIGTPFSTYNPYQYSSTYRDQASTDKELYYMVARYQDPAYGRFGQVDPIHIRGRQNYSYALNNPLSYLDPCGLDAVGTTVVTVLVCGAPTGLVGLFGSPMSGVVFGIFCAASVGHLMDVKTVEAPARPTPTPSPWVPSPPRFLIGWGNWWPKV